MLGSLLQRAAASIAGSRLHRLGGALSTPFASSQRTTTAREGVVLEIWDSVGHRGVGEASPLVGHSAETLPECVEALSDIPLRVCGLDEQGWPSIPNLAAVPSACFAWESALCDLAARQQGLSVAQLLGGHIAEVGRNAVIRDLDEAEAAWSRGVRTFKVKVGDPIKEESCELHFLLSLRRRFGPLLALRLDANGAWTIPEARQRIERLAVTSPEYVEQPVSAESLPLLGRCAVPWAADESLARADLAEALLGSPGCVAFVIKPALLGLRRARALAQRAQEHGRGVVITHALDGPIGLAAACELALSLPQAPWCCGLDVHAGLSAWPAVPVAQLSQSPALVCPSRSAGLGFSVEGLPWS